MATPPLPCPVCAALVMDDAAHIDQHVTWHAATKTLGPKTGSYGTAQHLRAGFAEMRRAVELVQSTGDDYPTAKLPPIRDRILPRPPAPEVRELRGAELLRALADEISRDLEAEDGTEDGPR